MKNSIEQVKDELQSVKIEVFKTGTDIEDRNSRLFQELKSEITSLKGLLLNRYLNYIINLGFLLLRLFLEKHSHQQILQ